MGVVGVLLDGVGGLTRRVDRSVSVGVICLVVHVGGRRSKQLEHMAACQQLKGRGLLFFCRSVYLSAFLSVCRGRGDQLALNQNRGHLKEEEEEESIPYATFISSANTGCFSKALEPVRLETPPSSVIQWTSSQRPN